MARRAATAFVIVLAGAATIIAGVPATPAFPASERATHPEIEDPAAETTHALGVEAPATTASSRDVRVPILMYHVVSDPPPSAPFPELYVSSRDFAGQMRWLDRRGYTAVTLHEVWEHWNRRGTLPERPVVITFDDGYRSIATSAAPVLQAHRWPGVLNLDASNIDAAKGFGEDRIAQLLRARWELNSHTLTHPDLTTLDTDSLRREVSGSRKLLRRTFHVPVDFFCYPSGRFDDSVVAAVKEAGYLGATTTNYGLAQAGDPYRLARVRVDRSDGVDGFAAKLVALEKR